MSASRPLVAVIAAVATVALSACSVSSTNFSAETNRAYDAGKGANSRDTAVGIYNALLVDNTPVDDTGAAAGEGGPANATLSATLVNRTEGAITLTGVTAQDAGGEPLPTQFAGDSGSIGLAPATTSSTDRRALVLGASDAEVVVDLGEVSAGSNVTLVFEFEGIDDIVLRDVPVVSRHDPIFEQIVDPNIQDEGAEETEEAALEEEAAAEDRDTE